MHNPRHLDGTVKRQRPELLGLTVTRAAEVLGVTRRGGCELVNERVESSVEMAIRLSKAVDGTTESLWGCKCPTILGRLAITLGRLRLALRGDVTY